MIDLDALDIAGNIDPQDFEACELRHDLVAYTAAHTPDYHAGWFHRDLATKLEKFSADVAAKRSPRMLIEAPPRHGKSRLTSECYPPWHLGKYPQHEIVVAGYGLAIAQDRTKAARDLALSETNEIIFPWARVSRDSSAKANWQLEGYKGSLRAVGQTGPLTGRGAEILILDDLVKDYAAALSPLQRDAVWNWYLSTAYTRLAPGGGIIIIMTRWHDDDLAGRALLEQADEGWEIVSYPAIATRDEKHRKVGEALHPERFPLEDLQKKKRALGSAIFQALYQQSPTSPGGSVWKEAWFNFWTSDKGKVKADPRFKVRPSSFGAIYQSWDLTFKATKSGSYVVGQVWGKRGSDLYLLDEVRGRWGFVETKAQIEATLKRWPATRKVLIEDKANGPAIIDALRGSLGRKIKAVQPDGSKIARAHAVAGVLESGRVYLPDPDAVPWVSDYVEEVCLFPVGANDDRVDSTSQFLRYAAKTRPILAGHL